jgi:DNA-directed RNA polymerase subunit RPC12/RpoP
MFNVCTACGLSHVTPEFDAAGYLVCQSCGHRRPFRRLPLMLVGGPAGAGKSTVGALLLGVVTEALIVESDPLWRREFNTPQDGYASYTSMWLLLSAHLSQSGRPVALFGAGFAVPHNFAALPECGYFSALHFLGLVCDDDVLTERLRRRPRWRNTTAELIAEHIEFNHWLKRHAAETDPPVTLIDTTRAAPAETAAAVAAWIRAHA